MAYPFEPRYSGRMAPAFGSHPGPAVYQEDDEYGLVNHGHPLKRQAPRGRSLSRSPPRFRDDRTAGSSSRAPGPQGRSYTQPRGGGNAGKRAARPSHSHSSDPAPRPRAEQRKRVNIGGVRFPREDTPPAPDPDSLTPEHLGYNRGFQEGVEQGERDAADRIARALRLYDAEREAADTRTAKTAEDLIKAEHELQGLREQLAHANAQRDHLLREAALQSRAHPAPPPPPLDADVVMRDESRTLAASVHAPPPARPAPSTTVSMSDLKPRAGTSGGGRGKEKDMSSTRMPDTTQIPKTITVQTLRLVPEDKLAREDYKNIMAVIDVGEFHDYPETDTEVGWYARQAQHGMGEPAVIKLQAWHFAAREHELAGRQLSSVEEAILQWATPDWYINIQRDFDFDALRPPTPETPFNGWYNCLRVQKNVPLRGYRRHENGRPVLPVLEGLYLVTRLLVSKEKHQFLRNKKIALDQYAAIFQSGVHYQSLLDKYTLTPDDYFGVTGTETAEFGEDTTEELLVIHASDSGVRAWDVEISFKHWATAALEDIKREAAREAAKRLAAQPARAEDEAPTAASRRPRSTSAQAPIDPAAIPLPASPAHTDVSMAQ